MLLSYIFGPRVGKYDILSNNRRSKAAVIDYFFRFDGVLKKAKTLVRFLGNSKSCRCLLFLL